MYGSVHLREDMIDAVVAAQPAHPSHPTHPRFSVAERER
jgi:hypothetical protein